MSEPTTRELYEIINEMRVDIGVMNTKMDFVMDSKKTAERAEQKADKALQKTDDHDDEIVAVEERLDKKIEAIKKTAMWAIGLTITALISLTAMVVSVIFN
jgi:GTP-binding protein EngB required for normal cell division